MNRRYRRNDDYLFLTVLCCLAIVAFSCGYYFASVDASAGCRKQFNDYINGR